LNTSGISNFPQAQYDMVRLGIGSLWSFPMIQKEQKQLENVGILKSIISSIPNDSIRGKRWLRQAIYGK